jgi:integrase
VTASYTTRALVSPKSGRVRSAPTAAAALARLSQREHWTGDDDRGFPGITGTYLDASALLKRHKRALRAAGLRPLRFHDGRHTFGTTMIRKADIVRVAFASDHAPVGFPNTGLALRSKHPKKDVEAALQDAEGEASGSKPVRRGCHSPSHE